MITKALVDSIVDTYHVRIRIPQLDHLSNVSVKTSKEDLNIATICTLPRCDLNIQPGDVVYVAFEDNDFSQVVVLGCLYRESISSVPNVEAKLFNCIDEAILPYNTSIGSVTPHQIDYLRVVQTDVEGLNRRITAMEEILKNVTRGE